MNTCIVAIQKNEKNIKEWCDWHLNVCGFSNIILFNNDCQSEDIKDKRVFQINFPRIDKYMPPQQEAYYKFILKYSFMYDYALFIDLDEYLNLHGKTIDQFIQEKKSNEKHFSICFNWLFYGSKTDDQNIKNGCLERFLYRGKKLNKHLKVMADLNMCRKANLNFCLIVPHVLYDLNTRRILPSLTQANTCVRSCFFENDLDPAVTPYLAHYYCKTKEEFENKIMRGRADCKATSVNQYAKKLDDTWKCFKENDQNDIYDDEMSKMFKKIKGTFK